MPYPWPIDWGNLPNPESTKHFRGKDGYPACGVYRYEYPNPNVEPVLRCITDDPHKVNCGRCLYTRTICEVS
jgi:hypothetical protein